ncbi:MAG: nicotinate (nicotinamide) nucleotide adenylyltransferase [Rikenellaceae bacterium]
MKRVMLYFGSFNPIHHGHIALAEYVIERNLCDEVVLIVSPRNPLKDIADLAPEVDRFEMVEVACSVSRYPDRIKPSIIEFLLERPSYTINTLRHLSENYGGDSSFSILMGGDIIPQFDKWRSYEEILASYPIFVYPRRGERVELYLDKITLLEGAPLQNFSSTDVRRALTNGESVEQMLQMQVAEYISKKKLWQAKGELAELNSKISVDPSVENLIARGKYHYRSNDFGKALNDFNKALAIDAFNTEATEFKGMIEEIFAFRHVDIYNP